MIKQQDVLNVTLPENALIWDVRDNAAYKEGHIVGAQNKPIDSLNVASLEAVSKNQTIYILCGGGTKAFRAAELLESLDAEREYVILVGGTRAAKAAGMTIVREE